MPPTPNLKIDTSSEQYVQQELKGRRMGRALTKLGKVTREQVHQALELQKTTSKGKKLGEVLIEMGLVKLVDIQTVLAGIAGMPFVSLKDRVISADVLKCIPPESARSYQIVPLEYDSTTKKV